MDLDEENEACLRELLTDTDVAGIAAATLPDASPEGAAMVEDFQGKLLTCLAGLLLPDDGGPAAGPPPPDDSLIWQYDTGTEGELVIVSPTVIEGVVYAGSYENRVYALDAETGELLWSFETESDLSPPPLVAGGVVFVEDLANLYALDASTGDLLWSEKSALGGSNHAALVSDGIVYIPTSPRDDDFSVSAVDAVSGEQLWATEMPRSGLPLFCSLLRLRAATSTYQTTTGCMLLIRRSRSWSGPWTPVIRSRPLPRHRTGRCSYDPIQPPTHWTSQRGRSFGATRWIPPSRISLLSSWMTCGI